jgi:glycosyltransferase involved in cell wall biosynthesis
MKSKQPLVSIVIPTYNSEKTLAKCLESIKNQTYNNIEVIVVDKFSKDRTVEIAKRFGAKVIVENLDRSVARNYGIKVAKGEYLLSIDSDMELTPKVIEECLEAINKNEKIGGVIIPEKSVGNSFWVKVRDFERSFYENTPIESARFFRMDLVRKVDGYDEDVIFFEESSLPQKIKELGYNVEKRINSVILHHEENFSLWKWLKKKYYYGKTAYVYMKKYKKYANEKVSLFYRFGLFLKNKKFYSKPLLAFGVIILKILEYFSAGFGFLISKIRELFVYPRK